MAIHAVCPSCNFPYVLGDELAGNLFTCTQCQAELKLPEPAATPLPPVDPAAYQRIAGTRWPLFLSMLGLNSIQESVAQGPGATLWACRHLFLLLATMIFLFVYATSTESALAAGPFFFLVSLSLIAFGYVSAVSIASRTFADDKHAQGPLADYLFKPVLVFSADPNAALPAIRVFFFALVLSLGTLLLGIRAGSLAGVVPTVDLRRNSPRSAYANPVSSQTSETAPISFNPTNGPHAADPPVPTPAPAVAHNSSPTATPPPPADTPAPPATPAQPTAAITQVPPPPPEE